MLSELSPLFHTIESANSAPTIVSFPFPPMTDTSFNVVKSAAVTPARLMLFAPSFPCTINAVTSAAANAVAAPFTDTLPLVTETINASLAA